MDQVEKAFHGRYREVNRETQQWYTYNHPVPEPRPGVVSNYLLPSAGEPVDRYMSVISIISWQLHERVSYVPVCSSVTSSILTDNQGSNKYPSWHYCVHLNMILIILIITVAFISWQTYHSWITEKCKLKKHWGAVQLQYVSLYNVSECL